MMFFYVSSVLLLTSMSLSAHATELYLYEVCRPDGTGVYSYFSNNIYRLISSSPWLVAIFFIVLFICAWIALKIFLKHPVSKLNYTILLFSSPFISVRFISQLIALIILDSFCYFGISTLAVLPLYALFVFVFIFIANLAIGKLKKIPHFLTIVTLLFSFYALSVGMGKVYVKRTIKKEIKRLEKEYKLQKDIKP